jgi:hypothetical protein
VARRCHLAAGRATAGKVALASTAVSLWWIAMLVVQGRHGADVLAYSESLESVSFTSTSTEVVRGLGYWLFYIRDAFMATTTASIDHLISVRVILAGFVLVGVCLVGVVTTRWAHRRYVAMLIGVGTILAVGVHPIDDPSPLMSLLVGDGEGGLALALRSSTRAVPVLLLGSALGAALLVDALRERRVHLPFTRRRVRSEVALAAVLGLIAVFNLPALRTGGFVDPALERDQDPPRAWLDAAADLDALPPALGSCNCRVPSSAPTGGVTPSTNHSPPSPTVRWSPATCCRLGALRRWTSCSHSTTASRTASPSPRRWRRSRGCSASTRCGSRATSPTTGSAWLDRRSSTTC